MSSSAPPPEPHRNDPISPDDALPNVEPPNAGFILQLFVVPGIIVLMIVMVWATFNWLARGTDDPMLLVAKIKTSSPTIRFQYANQLADVLRNPRHEAFRRNAAAARELADLLNDEIEESRTAEKSVELRVFLCRALGEFQVEEGLDVLIRAATTQRSTEELVVRQSAIEGIAVRAFYSSQAESNPMLGERDLEQALLKTADDQEELIRSRTAYAIGYLATPSLLTKLETMVDDPYPDARYNAALGLARHGRARAIEVLEEMLDMEESVGVELELEAVREFKRAQITGNALLASRLLAEKNPQADVSRLIAAIETLIEALADVDSSLAIHSLATDTLIYLKDGERSAP